MRNLNIDNLFNRKVFGVYSFEILICFFFGRGVMVVNIGLDDKSAGEDSLLVLSCQFRRKAEEIDIFKVLLDTFFAKFLSNLSRLLDIKVILCHWSGTFMLFLFTRNELIDSFLELDLGRMTKKVNFSMGIYKTHEWNTLHSEVLDKRVLSFPA